MIRAWSNGCNEATKANEPLVDSCSYGPSLKNQKSVMKCTGSRGAVGDVVIFGCYLGQVKHFDHYMIRRVY